MKKKVQRVAAKKAAPKKIVKKAAVHRLTLKPVPAEAMTADEVSHLETLVKRFEDSEKAWLRMTAPIDEADPWTQVEEHMLDARAGHDAERRWKFFAK